MPWWSSVKNHADFDHDDATIIVAQILHQVFSAKKSTVPTKLLWLTNNIILAVFYKWSLWKITPVFRYKDTMGKKRKLVFLKIPWWITISMESSRRDLFMHMVVNRSMFTEKNGLVNVTLKKVQKAGPITWLVNVADSLVNVTRALRIY